jgi:competence protein ComEC
MKTLKNAFLIFLLYFNTVNTFAQTDNKMYAHYINVGQANAMLLEFPKGAVLVDAGAQDDMLSNLTIFLNQFFARRTDLNRTLNAVFITHQHKDHDFGLKEVVSRYKVLNYIDNGHNNPHGSGQNQIWMENHVASLGIKYESISYDKVTQGGNLHGLTDAIIDPVGGIIDPKFTVYSGAYGDGEISNLNDENNHSLVIKVTYGKASFLFMGDLELDGIKKVLAYYSSAPKELNADVMQVGHHGAKNATTDAWIKAVSPHYAVINCGKWDYGMQLPDSTAEKFTTYAYAHPTKMAIDILQSDISDTRSNPIIVHVGLKGTASPHIKPVFTTQTITKSIYATAWNGNIQIAADANGTYTVTTDH